MPPPGPDVIPLREATRAWFAISLQTFGGPAGQIAVMQHKLVDEKRWIGQQRFLHALNYCMLLPGPEAQQLAIYIGWLLNGIRGGLIAGTLFVLPGMLALLALSAVYVAFGEHQARRPALFAGLAPAVIGDRRPGGPPGRHRAPCATGCWCCSPSPSFVALTVLRRAVPDRDPRAPALVGWLLGRWMPVAAHRSTPAPVDGRTRPADQRRRPARRRALAAAGRR